METKKLMTIATVIVLAVAGVAACVVVTSGGGNDDGGNGKAVAVPCEPYTFTDLAGQEFTFDHTLGAIAPQWSGAGGPFMTMAALLGDDLCDYLVGIDSTLTDYRVDVWNAYRSDMPALSKLPSVGGIGSSWDSAAVLLLEPDALITALAQKSDVESNGVSEVFSKADIPIIYLDFHSENRDNIVKSIEILGMLFGKTERAKDIAELYSQKVTSVYEKVEEVLKTNERPDIYVECTMSGTGTIGNSYNNSYLWGALIYNCGGNSIMTSRQGQIDNTYLLTTDPDKILLTGSIWSNGNDFVHMGFGADEATSRTEMKAFFDNRTGWSNLSAWKATGTEPEGHDVYAVSHILSRDVYDFATIEFVAQMIWPDVFGDLDPVQDLKDFYEAYMPFDYDGLWFLEYA